MTIREMMPLRITEALLSNILASGLYADSHACLWEIVRNAVCACMPDSKVWTPGVGDVEIILDENFPGYAGVQTLIVLDHGHGFTPEDMDRFCHLGPSRADLRSNPGGSNGGASQKRTGRWAGIPLNAKNLHEGDQRQGFHVFTRTGIAGSVTHIPVIPEEIAKHQGMQVQTLEARSKEIGFLGSVRGSFTAVVIPHSVYTTYADIKTALLWRLPRKRDQVFKLLVGGKRMVPPPLPSHLTAHSEDEQIQIFADKRRLTGEPGGLWFTDMATGLRVAEARRLSALLPHPYGSSDLVGDIFVPDLLSNQDTARGGLSAQYLRSQVWRWKVLAHLHKEAYRFCALLGIDNADDKPSPVKDTMDDLIKRFTKVWGPPRFDIDADGGTSEVDEDDTEKRDPASPKARRAPGTSSRVRPSGTRRSDPEKKLQRGSGLRIGDTTYIVASQGLDPRIFAEVEGDRLWTNDHGYKYMPPTKEARAEHTLTCVLTAVARSIYPEDPLAAQYWMAERRGELMGKKV